MYADERLARARPHPPPHATYPSATAHQQADVLAPQHSHATGGSGQLHPVPLRFLTRRVVDDRMVAALGRRTRLAMRAQSELTHRPSERRIAAQIAKLADLVIQGDRRQVRMSASRTRRYSTNGANSSGTLRCRAPGTRVPFKYARTVLRSALTCRAIAEIVQP
jgi:hypothetical protein